MFDSYDFFFLSLVGLSFCSSLWHEMAPIICLFKGVKRKKNAPNQVNSAHADNAFLISFGVYVISDAVCNCPNSITWFWFFFISSFFFTSHFHWFCGCKLHIAELLPMRFKTNENGILIDLYVASIIAYKLNEITRSQFTWWLKWSAANQHSHQL